MLIINQKLEDIKLEKIIALDTEFNSLRPISSFVLAISITSGGITYVIDRCKYDDKEIIGLLSQIKDKCEIIVAHNAKIDCLVLYSNFGILLRNWFCTMLASQNIDKGYGVPAKGGWTITRNMVGGVFRQIKPHSLVSCLERYLGIKYELDKKNLQMSFTTHSIGEELSKEQLEYAGEDTKYLIPLMNKENKWVEKRGLSKCQIIDNALILVLTKMELRGVLIDQEKQIENILKWEDKLYEIELGLNKILVNKGFIEGTEGRQKRVTKRNNKFTIGDYIFDLKDRKKEFFNYGSDKQLGDLFDYLGIPKPRDTKGETKSGYSFSEDNLKMYLVEHEVGMEEFINLLFDYKEIDKKLSTYGEKLLECIDEDGRMRTSYGITTTDTGRLNSFAVLSKKKGDHRDSGLNLANIPKDNDLRNIFIVDEGYSFIDCDATGQEAILAADYSKEPLLVDAFTKGIDHHSVIATEAFKIIFKDEDFVITNEDKIVRIKGNKDQVFEYNMKKDLRQDCKNATFSKFYGAGKDRVYEYLNRYINNHHPLSEGSKVAGEISEAIDNCLPVLTKWLRGLVKETHEKGYIIGQKLGARRYFDNAKAAFGEIMNFPVQNAGAFNIKLALIRTDKYLQTKSKELGIKEEELGCIVLTVYDQNLVSIKDKYVDLVKDDIQQIMADSLTFMLSDLKGSSDLNITSKWEK